jgi:ribosome-binding factor A
MTWTLSRWLSLVVEETMMKQLIKLLELEVVEDLKTMMRTFSMVEVSKKLKQTILRMELS